VAFIKLSSGQYRTVTAEQGSYIWQVLNNEVEPRDEQDADRISQVEKVILNRHNPCTPMSYLQRHPDTAASDGEYAVMLGIRR